MWFTALAMAGVLCLLIYLQMADHQENAVATLVIGPPEELNDNDTADQFSEDNGTLKDNDDEVAEKISNGAEWSHLVETDSPFLAPVPHRGKTCEPGFVRNTAEFLADLRGDTLEELDR